MCIVDMFQPAMYAGPATLVLSLRYHPALVEAFDRSVCDFTYDLLTSANFGPGVACVYSLNHQTAI